MRAFLPQYDMQTPRDLNEALHLLQESPGKWRPFAGGTDLMVLFEAGKLSHKHFVNIWRLKELKGIEESPTHLTMGALTTYSEIQKNKIIQKEFPNLFRAAQETGAIAIQNRGTLGGNIVNASPAADSPPALLTYEAEIELISAKGSRWVEYKNFHKDYKKTELHSDELVSKVRLPRQKQIFTHYYRKVGTRKAQAISKTCMSAIGRLEQNKISNLRIALGSVAAVPIRCPKTEAHLNNQVFSPKLRESAKAILSKEISPIDDIRSTSEYRLQVTLNLLEDFLKTLCGTGSQNQKS